MLRKLACTLSLAIAALFCVPSASAQFIGYTSPQTAQQTLANAVNCTGTAQTFNINNLGQVQHYLSLVTAGSPTQFTAFLQGTDLSGNTYQISDTAANISGAILGKAQGALSAAGYYPKLQAVVTCLPITATFTLTYSGASAAANSVAGAFLNTQIDKSVFVRANAGVTQSNGFVTPFGSSAGTIFFSYIGAGSTAGATLVAQCSTNQFSNPFTTSQTPLSVTLATGTQNQVFELPDLACPTVQITFTNTGATDLFSVEYVFTVPGISTRGTTDPCTSGAIAKQNAAVAAAAATTTQIVPLTASDAIYVCGYQLSQVATAGTVAWEYGTGASCGTGTTSLTGSMGMTASQPISYGDGHAYVFRVPNGNALCLVATGAGGTVGGVVTYVQSP